VDGVRFVNCEVSICSRLSPYLAIEHGVKLFSTLNLLATLITFKNDFISPSQILIGGCSTLAGKLFAR